jgi:hypothetical protein
MFLPSVIRIAIINFGGGFHAAKASDRFFIVLAFRRNACNTFPTALPTVIGIDISAKKERR